MSNKTGLTIKVDNAKLRRLAATSPATVDAWLRGVAEEMVSDIKLSFGTSPAGKTYKRGQKRVHIASQPGYAPNVDMGTLRASIRWEAAGDLTYHIMDGVEYGQQLEFGTTRIAARPFMTPVFTNWAGKIEADAQQRLKLE